MAGTVSAVYHESNPPVSKTVISWTSDGSGDADITLKQLSGILIKAVTVPDGTDAPSANYDITITDSNSVNLLTNSDNNLLNRHQSNTEEVYFIVTGGTQLIAFVDTLTVTVANAGDSKKGVIELYWIDR